MSRLGSFHGTLSDAEALARLDHRQFLILAIKAYQGDASKRSTMQFEVAFDDDTISWLPYSQDLASTVQFEQFCTADPYLFPLLFPVARATVEIANMKKNKITTVKPDDECFINLRRWGEDWYLSLNLHDPLHINYFVTAKFLRWAGRHQRNIDVYCPLLDVTFMWNSYEVFTSATLALLATDVLVTPDYLDANGINLSG